MKTVGPFVAARPLDSGVSGAAQPITTLHALDRLTGLPALVYLLPQAVTLSELPDSPSLLPYVEAGIQGEQTYVACELPPHAGLASDPLQTALGGLRALNALHEAGLVHGGVGPHQLWEWDGEVRLAGAALPWGEAQGALAAPEGGVSPAADLYALGVTLLRMGPLPAGLSDLLSPYPAQRPSARDALARFNAGPPLPTPVAPLMVQAPLHPREPGRSPSEAPLPLIADPEQRIAPLPAAIAAASLPDDPVPAGLPVFDWGGAEAGESPEPTGAHAGPQPAEIKTTGTDAVPTAAQPDATESELLEFLAAFPAADAPPMVVLAPPPQAVTVEAEPELDDEEVVALLPAPEAEPAEAPLASADLAPDPATPPAEAEALVFSSAAPAPVITAGEAAQVRPETAPADSGLPNPPAPEAAMSAVSAAAAVVSPRQLRPVKIGWSQDGAWQVKKESGDAAAAGVDARPPGSVGGPPPLVRPPNRASATQPSAAQPRARRSTDSRFNPLWLLVLVLAVVLLVLLAQRAFRSNDPAVGASACCIVTARLVGSSGQSLSAPVKISIGTAPAASRLKAGTLVGQAPGPLALDTPGDYALKVVGDGYAPQTVNVTVPTAEPLVITLK